MELVQISSLTRRSKGVLPVLVVKMGWLNFDDHSVFEKEIIKSFIGCICDFSNAADQKSYLHW